MKGPLPLFINDLECDTLGWSDAEKWRYLKLLCYLWSHNGFIEDNDEIIAAAMGVNRARNWREKLLKVRYILITSQKKPGYLTQKRIIRDITKAAEISQKRAQAGRIGGQANAKAKSKPLSPTLSPIVKKEDSPPLKGPPPKGTRLPDNWTLPSEWRQWAIDEGYGDRLDIDLTAKEFHDYWTDRPDKLAVKKTWKGTWRNWVRKNARTNRGNGHGKRPDPYAGNRTMQTVLREMYEAESDSSETMVPDGPEADGSPAEQISASLETGGREDGDGGDGAAIPSFLATESTARRAAIGDARLCGGASTVPAGLDSGSMLGMAEDRQMVSKTLRVVGDN